MTANSALDGLLERRRESFCQRPDLAVRTLEEAARFIDQVGLALLFPQRGTLLPSLWGAAGGPDPLTHWDERVFSLVWRWRDQLSSERRAFYGKYLAGRASFVSLEMMPLVIAAAGGIPDGADLEAEYEEGRLPREQLAALRAIRQQGPIGTVALRRACALGGSRLTREVEELERRFLVVRLGSRREARRRWPSNLYDLLSRAYPSVAAEAAEHEVREASRQVAERYLSAVVFATPADLAAALGWPPPQAKTATGDLVATRRARQAADEEGLPPGTIVSKLETRNSRLASRDSSLELRASKP